MDGDFTVFDTLDRVAVGDVRTRLRDILAAFLFRGEDIDKKVKVLSGGERSRLAMARLMLEPYNMLVLDEPTAVLSEKEADMLLKAIRNLSAHGIAVIFITHSVDEAVYLSDRIVVLTKRPAQIKEIVDIPWERPRDRASPEFTALRKKILEELRSENVMD